MDTIGLILLAPIIGGLALALWWRVRERREERLRTTYHGVRCPVNDSPAELSVRTDPAAPSGRQHLEVTSCSLLADVATGLPERTAYLPDAPTWRVCLDPATTRPVYAARVPCAQPCVFVLNASEIVQSPALECSSGVSDAMDLSRQAMGGTRATRLALYALL